MFKTKGKFFQKSEFQNYGFPVFVQCAVSCFYGGNLFGFL